MFPFPAEAKYNNKETSTYDSKIMEWNDATNSNEQAGGLQTEISMQNETLPRLCGEYAADRIVKIPAIDTERRRNSPTFLQILRED